MNAPSVIFLSGFMGSGKTSVGRELARLLNLQLIDTDQTIEQSFGLTVKEIFSKKGEPFFRQLETDLLKKLAVQKNKVVSLGGGIPLSAVNRSWLNKGHWVYLKTSSAQIKQRLIKDQSRPLLNQNDKSSQIEALQRQRRPFYELAPWHILTDHKNPAYLARRIAKLLKGRLP